MKDLSEILTLKGMNHWNERATKSEFFQIIDGFFLALNNERRIKSYMNFKKFWAQNANLTKEEAVTQFKKTKGQFGYLKPLSKSFIAMSCATAKISMDDWYHIQKRARRVGYTRQFPWPRYGSKLSPPPPKSY